MLIAFYSCHSCHKLYLNGNTLRLTDNNVLVYSSFLRHRLFSIRKSIATSLNYCTFCSVCACIILLRACCSAVSLPVVVPWKIERGFTKLNQIIDSIVHIFQFVHVCYSIFNSNLTLIVPIAGLTIMCTL